MVQHFLAPSLTPFYPPDPLSLPLHDAKAQTDGTGWSTYDLLRQRNSLVRISRLPPEILETIFIHYARDYHECYRSCIRVAHWVNVSYVCHHWRHVALNCPVLWTYHFTVSLRWTEELLARSKQAPLKIYLLFAQNTRLPWSTLLAKLMDHIEHIQELQLRLPAQFLPTRFFLNAPRLQALKIAVSTDRSLWRFDGAMPALHTLDLVQCGVPWHSLACSNLTTLLLRDIPSGYLKTVVEFRAILSRMPNLAVLHLDNALASTYSLPSDLYASSPKTTLPRLVRLAVSAPLSTVVAFLCCVGIPGTTHVRLDFQAEDPFTEAYTLVPPLLAQRFRLSNDTLPLPYPSIHTLVVEAYSSQVNLTFTSLERIAHGPWHSNAPLQVGFRMRVPMAEGDRERIISDVCCALPLTHVQNLDVFGDSPLSPAFWERMLGHLPGLRYVNSSGEDGELWT